MLFSLFKAIEVEDGILKIFGGLAKRVKDLKVNSNQRNQPNKHEDQTVAKKLSK